jgi:hypothetical protein
MADHHRFPRQGRRQSEKGDGVINAGTMPALRCCAGAALLAGLAITPSRAIEMPDAVAAPDAAPTLTLHAEGAQVYECTAGTDGKLAWTFREPIATLILDGKTVGRHSAGPIWEHADGSVVRGKVVGNAPAATANDIAWLKLDVVDRRGAGILSAADIVQRINTSGGALHGSCEQAGALRSIAYSADYVFLHKNR